MISGRNQNGFAQWLKCSKVINKQTNKNKSSLDKMFQHSQKTESCLIYDVHIYLSVLYSPPRTRYVLQVASHLGVWPAAK